MNPTAVEMSSHSPAASKPVRPPRMPALDYVVQADESDQPRPTQAALKALAQLERLRKARNRLDAAYAGGLILVMFHRAPWLQSCSFVLTASSEYNDEGGYSRSVRFGNVTELIRVSGVEPSAELCLEGLFSSDAANEWVEEFFEHDAASLYEVFRDDDALDDLEISCDRARVAGELARLADRGKSSGALAFAALWPEEAWRLKSK